MWSQWRWWWLCRESLVLAVVAVVALVVSISVLVTGAFGQTAEFNQLTLVAGAPPSEKNFGGVFSGAQGGTTTIYYWIVVKYPIGDSIMMGPLPVGGTPARQNLNASNLVNLNWSPMPSAVGYDIVWSTTAAMPGFPCSSCGVLLGTTDLAYSDDGSNNLAYSGPDAAGEARATMNVDNLTESEPYIAVMVNGISKRMALLGPGQNLVTVTGTPVAGNCSSWASATSLQDSGGACGGAVLPAQEIGYGDGVGIISSPNLTWDDVNKQMVIDTVNPPAATRLSPFTSVYGLTAGGPASAYGASSRLTFSGGSILSHGTAFFGNTSISGTAAIPALMNGVYGRISLDIAVPGANMVSGLHGVFVGPSAAVASSGAGVSSQLQTGGGTVTDLYGYTIYAAASSLSGSTNFYGYYVPLFGTAATGDNWAFYHPDGGLLSKLGGGVQHGDYLFAALGAPDDGTTRYCTDCLQTNPCAGAGTGALARMENGIWNCGAPAVTVPSVRATFALCLGIDCAVDTNLTNVWISDAAYTISKCYAYAKTAPVGSVLTFDVNRNGVDTIFSAAFSIADGANAANTTNISAAGALVESDFLTVDIDAVGAGTAGSNVTVMCVMN